MGRFAKKDLRENGYMVISHRLFINKDNGRMYIQKKTYDRMLQWEQMI
jgi:hypothetical protein